MSLIASVVSSPQQLCDIFLSCSINDANIHYYLAILYHHQMHLLFVRSLYDYCQASNKSPSKDFLSFIKSLHLDQPLFHQISSCLSTIKTDRSLLTLTILIANHHWTCTEHYLEMVKRSKIGEECWLVLVIKAKPRELIYPLLPHFLKNSDVKIIGKGILFLLDNNELDDVLVGVAAWIISQNDNEWDQIWKSIVSKHPSLGKLQ
jgi:hypothetical protein